MYNIYNFTINMQIIHLSPVKKAHRSEEEAASRCLACGQSLTAIKMLR